MEDRGEMMETDDWKHPGRRGLFMVTEEEKNQPDTKETTGDYSEIVAKLLTYTNGEFPKVPDAFVPILNRLKQDADTLFETEQNLVKISKELEKLKEEQDSIKREHESYLSDLISAHTEFDRALEIFQYHTIPMVLLGSEQQILDANDIFCTIFSVERSEITRQFPSISKYVPDERPFTAPDGNIYSIVSIKPPIVPFDHEAVSLDLLIPYTSQEESKAQEVLSKEILEAGLSEILFPVAIVDGYHTIRFINRAFFEFLGREHQEVYLRDIASSGFSGDIIEIIDTVLSSGTKSDFQTSIYHKDGTAYPVWVQVIPLSARDEPHVLVVLFPDEEEEGQTPEINTQKTSEVSAPFLKTLLDLNPSPMVLFDETSRVILANEGLSELIGVSSDQLQGQNLTDIGITVTDYDGMSEEIEVLPDRVCIESPYGVQCYSGLLISNRTITPAQYILILQPPIEAAPEVETEKARDIKEPEPDTPLISEPEEIKKTDPLPSIQFSLVPIPGIIIKESVITAMNASFQEWSGIHEGNLPEYAPVLLSHAVQARENRSLVLSSVYPAGLKSYQIVSQTDPHSPNAGLFWFLDQTEAQEIIANLKTRIENLSSELTSVTNNLQEERSAIKGSDDISRQIDIVEFELSGGRYAMDIGMVREVVEMLPITPLPKAPPYIIGIINLRGEVTHVIDLAILLGERVKKDRAGQKIIIVPPDAAHGEHLGIIVDNVRSVTEIGARQVTPLGDEINERIKTRIKGIIKVTHDDFIEKHDGEEKEANLVIWLEMKEILNNMAGLH